jgi:hypothetical protein
MKLHRVDSELAPVLVHVTEEAPHTLVASIDHPLELGTEGEPLAVRVTEADEPVGVASVERLEGAANGLDVLLRNTPSPNLRVGHFIPRV